MVSTMSEYHARMKKIRNHLGGRCVICGVAENLHVDHVNHLNKSFNVGENWGRAWSVLEKELEKCQLLCEEHHREKTAGEGSLAKGWTNQKRVSHGSVSYYVRYGCRCALCKRAKSEYERKRRLTSKQDKVK